MLNFTGVLNDGKTDTAIVEQEVICYLLDPDNFEPCLSFKLLHSLRRVRMSQV